MRKPPSYNGSGLVNLVAEIETRLTGTAPFPGLREPDLVPGASTYVLVLFDGLGMAQIDHDAAAPFRPAVAGSIDSPFPSMTNVSLASIGSGLSPSQHGQVAHLTWYPDLEKVVNTLKWVTVHGEHVPYEYAGLLPRPNLWERLRTGGVEPITVQPGEFEASPLTRAMYRGARFEGVWDTTDLVDATVTLAREDRRLVFTYVPFVDVAGHVFGQGSDEFAEAMKTAARIWDGIVAGLPPGAAVIGTADHGLMEVTDRDKILIRDPRFESLRFAGDPRGVHLWGDSVLIQDLAEATGGDLVDPLPLLGPDPSAKTLSHLGDRLLLAPTGRVLLPRGFDKRLRCYHGGLMPEEVEIPVLVG
ncbi:MAG: alkaline phosphatase family protein [Acidimicrobiia bacterium]|jgi:hypothetical protein